FKTLGNHSIALFKVATDKTSPFIDLGADVNFRFYLETERSDEFYNITDLNTNGGTIKYEAGNKLHFSNVPANFSIDESNPESLEHVLVDRAFGNLFTYSYSLTTNHVKTSFRVRNSDGQFVSVGKDTDGNPLPTALILTRDDAKVFHRQVDLRDQPNGVYTIVINNVVGNNPGPDLLKEETILLDNEAVSRGVLGIVDITYNATNDLYGSTKYYGLKFSRKTTIWKYFIVNKSNNIDLSPPPPNLSIIDSVNGSGLPYNNVSFVREGDEPHATTRVKGFDTVIFKSDSEIPSFERPKTSVQLRHNPGGEIIVEHLANPPVNTVEKYNSIDDTIEKEIFVFI
ncbi:MAG: hypothetical protein AAFP76_11095, partial [Bacteroidota bacterium]